MTNEARVGRSGSDEAVERACIDCGKDVSERPRIFVHTDHNPDEVRSFYEIPDALARRIQPADDRRTFAQCLADLTEALDA